MAASRDGSQNAQRTSHIFVVVMENEAADAIYGNAAAPYINNVLLPSCASASNFSDATPSLPSEPHYIRMEAGTNSFADHTFETDGSPSASNSTRSTEHLAAQIAARGGGVDWMEYVEATDLSAQPCPISGTGVYVPRHDPFVFFQDISGSPPSKTSATCAAHHRDISAMTNDLATGNVASYVFITPDLCHDMHGGSSCPGGNNLQMGDSWLSTALPPIIAYVTSEGGVIFVAWDQGGSDQQSKLPFLAIGPGVKAGYRSPVALSHGSLTKTIEEMLDLPILPAVQDVADLADLFSAGAVP